MTSEVKAQTREAQVPKAPAQVEKKEMTVAFIGNPNCGKTTLFNAYTGANLKVANWPGVTVERSKAPSMPTVITSTSSTCPGRTA